MAEARLESAKVIEQGRKVAETMKDEILAKAKEEAASVVAKAREEIQSEKRAAMAELQASVADLSVAVAGKVIGTSLSDAEHRKLIESYVAEVGRLDGN
jgi:F-type H+-transporting ATPase subunit b